MKNNMKVSNSSERLKEIMRLKGLSQADLLRLCEPISNKYGVNLNRSILSEYINNKYEPAQSKLLVLGEALNVSEAWLMGYDVPMERTRKKEAPTTESVLTDFEQQVVNLCKVIPEDKREDFIDYLKTAVKMIK